MFLVGLISWWYGRGWLGQWQRSGQLLLRTLDFFSVAQLLRTLFSPFRQISSGIRGNGSLGSMVSVVLDKLISRIIGALIRSATILFGLIVIVLQTLYVICKMSFWLIIPALPFIGAALYMLGWSLRG